MTLGRALYFFRSYKKRFESRPMRRQKRILAPKLEDRSTWRCPSRRGAERRGEKHPRRWYLRRKCAWTTIWMQIWIFPGSLSCFGFTTFEFWDDSLSFLCLNFWDLQRYQRDHLCIAADKRKDSERRAEEEWRNYWLASPLVLLHLTLNRRKSMLHAVSDTYFL